MMECKSKKAFVQATAPLISEEEPHNLHSLWHCCELGTEFGDIAKATTTPRQVCDPARASRPSSLTGREGERKKKKNEWQAEPIKHEVECEGMYPPLFHKHLRNVRRTLSVLSMRSLISHWSASLLSLFISKLLDPALSSLQRTLKHQEDAASVWITTRHDGHIYRSRSEIITATKIPNAAMFFGGCRG